MRKKDNEIKDRRTKNLDKSQKIKISCIMIVVLLISIVMICIWKNNLNQNSGEILYSYSQNRNLDYSVNLYKNNFIASEKLTSGQTYIADLVKNIDSNLKYSFSGSKKVNATCTYKVLATIDGKYQSTSNDDAMNVWQKEYVLLEEKTLNYNDVASFNVEENILIDYNFYNNEVSEFRKKLKLPITAVLNVKMMITTNFETIDKTAKDSKYSTIEYSIPLNIQAFNIKTNYKENEKDTVFTSSLTKASNFIGILGIFLIAADLFAFLYYFNDMFGIRIKSAYEKEVGKILNKYSSIVIRVNEPVDTTNLKIVYVASFSEILDLEQELRVPILFYEKVKGRECYFTLLHNDMLYRYILKYTNREIKISVNYHPPKDIKDKENKIENRRKHHEYEK